MIIDPNLAVDTIKQATVEYVIEKIVDVVHPTKIILFGSLAHGGQRPESDIDLLIITKPEDDRELVRMAIERALRGRRFAIDLLVRTPADVEWNMYVENPFYVDDILRDGQIVYER
jgi:predicted nucleotidyltransferase